MANKLLTEASDRILQETNSEFILLENNWKLIGHASAFSADTLKAQTAGFDTTGADLLVLAASWFDAPGSPTISDSKSNSWNALTLQTYNGSKVRISWSTPTSVGASHTFLADGGATAIYPALAVLAFSGSKTSPFDQESGAASSLVRFMQGGPITPTVPLALIVSALGMDAVTNEAGGRAMIDNAYSIEENQPYTFARNLGCAIAWRVQALPAAIDPQWSWYPSPNGVAVVNASFKQSQVFQAAWGKRNQVLGAGRD